MSYDEARNTPLYSLEVSDINYAGKDPDLIISTLTPRVGALKYQEMKLYFDKNKGLKSVLLALMLIPVSRPIKLMMAGKHSPYIMRKLRSLIENMGQRQSKKSSLQTKGNSIKVFPPALQNSRSGIVKIESE